MTKTKKDKIKDVVLDKLDNNQLRNLVELILNKDSIEGDVYSKIVINNNKEKVRTIHTVELDIL